jgi:hypothetical protein
MLDQEQGWGLTVQDRGFYEMDMHSCRPNTEHIAAGKQTFSCSSRMIHCKHVRQIFKHIDDWRCKGSKLFVDLDYPSHVHKDNKVHHFNHVWLAQMKVCNEAPC